LYNCFISQISKWFRNDSPDVSLTGLSVDPEIPFFAVGDIHGSIEPLKRLMSNLDDAAIEREKIVFLGDYIDRGGQSQQVLTWLFETTLLYPDKMICLMGNHERMMLDFIDDPAGRGTHWLQNGGLDTLASFGVMLHQRELDTNIAVKIANALEAAMPVGMHEWLRALPLRWSSGNVHCVHAAMSPRRTVQDQCDHVLLWGHPDFMTTPRNDGHYIVHGHTIVKNAGVTGNRISVDTGVYRTGRLSAVRIAVGECRFFES